MFSSKSSGSNDSVERNSKTNKGLGRDSDSERDSNQDIEEFSSFDISDDNISRNESDNQKETSSDLYREYENDEEKSIPSTANTDSAFISTPKTPKSNFSGNNTNEFNAKVTNVDHDTKPSSRMSSDTFETPKTVETRTSTMTSNLPFDYGKQLNYELSLPSATLTKRSKAKDSTKDINPDNGKISAKRLSRRTDDDVSIDKDLDYSSSSINQSMNSLFAKLSLDSDKDKYSSNLIPSTSDLVDLQNQLTNCKIQIKLQNDLLRERIYQSLGDRQNKQELSEELERKIFNSLNSCKLKFQLNHANAEYQSLKAKYEKLLSTSEDLNKSIELLRDQHADLTNNQHEWQIKIKDLIYNIKSSLMLDSPDEINDFHDILNTLCRYVEKILDELLDSRDKMKDLSDQSAASREKINSLLERIKSREQAFEFVKKELTKKVESSEYLNFNYKSKIFDYENLLKTEKSNFSALEAKYVKLQSQYDELKNEVQKGPNKVEPSNRIGQLEDQVNSLRAKNTNMRRNLKENRAKVDQLITRISSYHSVLLTSFMSVIDPSSSGNVLDACSGLTHKSDYNEALKVFSVAHNFEINSLNTILENYQILLKERNLQNLQGKTISELQGEIMFLTQKINDLESMKDSETVRIHELQTQNIKLKEIVNEKVNKVDQLEKLRLEDLNKKWKAAEEALSQTKKGAQLKISELEEELSTMKAQLARYESS